MPQAVATRPPGYYCPRCGYELSAAMPAGAGAALADTAARVRCSECGGDFAPAEIDRVAHGFVRTWLALGPAGWLAIVASVLPPLGGFVLLAYLGTVSEYLRSHGWAGLAIYVACFAALAGLALLPTYSQSVLGGYAFGWALGIPAALAGFVGAAAIGYEIARRASGERVLAQIEARPKVKAVRDAFLSERMGAGFWKTFGFVALLRLPPNSPFALTNLLLASVRVPRPAFILGTLVGMAPRTAAAVVVGATAERLTGEEDLKNPWWMIAAAVAVSVVVLGILGSVANRAIRRVTASAGSGSAG